MNLSCLTVNDVSPDDVADINQLLRQLSSTPRELCIHDIRAVVARTTIAAARDTAAGNKIVGMATMCVVHKLTGAVGHVEDVVVLQNYRRRNIGRGLIELLISEGGKLRLRSLDLTSRAARQEANGLYQSLGFALRETNSYRRPL